VQSLQTAASHHHHCGRLHQSNSLRCSPPNVQPLRLQKARTCSCTPEAVNRHPLLQWNTRRQRCRQATTSRLHTVGDATLTTSAPPWRPRAPPWLPRAWVTRKPHIPAHPYEEDDRRKPQTTIAKPMSGRHLSSYPSPPAQLYLHLGPPRPRFGPPRPTSRNPPPRPPSATYLPRLHIAACPLLPRHLHAPRPAHREDFMSLGVGKKPMMKTEPKKTEIKKTDQHIG
jgi:hypothetical protein